MDDLAKRARETLEGVTPSRRPNFWRVQKRYSFIAHKDTWQVVWDVPISTGIVLIADTGGDTLSAERDARFIAAARTIVPVMADRIEAIEAEMEARIAEAVKAEREACARIAEARAERSEEAGYRSLHVNGRTAALNRAGEADAIAAHIRARGNQ